MDGLLAIGAFSRASSISVRTLRNYHESGLLVPAAIDPATGYRSYTVDQLADAIAIVRLRALDVPLPLVQQIVQARDPLVTRAVLAGHEEAMRERLAETQRIVETLQRGLPSTITPPHAVNTPATSTLQCSATVPSDGLWRWLEKTAETLCDLAQNHRLEGGYFSSLYTDALLDEESETVTAFVPLNGPFLLDSDTLSQGITIGEIRPTRWVALVHAGEFETIGETYRILGAWVGRNTNAAEGRSICEVYHRLDPTSASDDQAIELRWPVLS